MKTIVFFHGKCFDGSMAAAAALKAVLKRTLPGDTLIHPISYMDDMFKEGGLVETLNPDGDKAKYYFVDFCPTLDALRRISEMGDEAVVLDHHESAQNNVKEAHGLPGLSIFFDMGRSGAGMAWEHFHGKHDIPELTQYVEDRDLWKFRLEGTREAIAWLSVSATLDSPSEYLAAIEEFEEHKDRCIHAGIYIRKEMEVQIAAMGSKWRGVTLEGYPMGAIVNATCYPSEVAEYVYTNWDVPYVIVYSITKDGRVALSLRSNQYNPKSIAVNAMSTRLFGGGGHRNAAGGSTSLETLNELLLSSQSQKNTGAKTMPADGGCECGLHKS